MKKNIRFLPLYAYFLALMVFILFLGVYHVLGFGNFTILRGDLYVQYIDFISLFLKVLRGEESFWYSFSIYFGSGTALTYAYYTLSPFNLLYLLDFISIPTMTAIIIMLKISLSAATFTFFAIKVLKRNDIWVLFFSLCYAFNSFTMCLHFNIIWLDAIFMLPLIVTFLFILVRKKSFLPLCLAWFYLFVTNFYISFMIGVFASLAFVAILVLHFEHWNKTVLKESLSIIFRFALSVILAAGLSAAVLFPAAVFLLSHMAEDNSAFEILDTSIPAIINSMFIGELPDLDNRLPLLYCGLPVLLLFPLYFTKSAFSKKERIVAAVFVLFYVFSMLILPLYVFMHAFDFPNWYGYRFSFCLCFVLCLLALHVIPELKNADLRFIISWSCILLFLYSVMIALGPLITVPWNKLNTRNEFGVNLAFIAFWCAIAHLYFRRSPNSHSHQKIYPFLFLAILIGELVTNGYLCMKRLGISPISETEFDQWYTPLKQSVTEIQSQDNELYRLSVFDDANQCSSCMFGYAGFNTFSSSDNFPFRRALHGLGIATSNRAIQECGYTDLTYLLFGAKYRIHLPAEDDILAPSEVYYELLPYNLPFGYMVSKGIYQYEPGDNPFDNQEQLLAFMTGHEYHFFEQLTIEDLNLLSFNAYLDDTDQYKIFSRRTELGGTGYITFAAPLQENKDFYACFTVDQASADAYSALVVGAANGFHETPAMSYGAIAKGAEYYGGEKNGFLNISVYLPEECSDYVCRKMYFVYYNNSELPLAHSDLMQGGWQINTHTSDRIEADVYATEDRSVLFTSIPYEIGWGVLVDGNPQQLNATLDDAFLSVDLTPGNHHIILSYTAPGAKAGKLISVISACVFIILSITHFLCTRNYNIK